MAGERRYHCNNCFSSFSVTVGTIFHRTRLPLSTWFDAMVLLRSSSFSSRDLAKRLGINKSSAWRIEMLLRRCTEDPRSRDLLNSLLLVLRAPNVGKEN